MVVIKKHYLFKGIVSSKMILLLNTLKKLNAFMIKFVVKEEETQMSVHIMNAKRSRYEGLQMKGLMLKLQGLKKKKKTKEKF